MGSKALRVGYAETVRPHLEPTHREAESGEATVSGRDVQRTFALIGLTGLLAVEK
jgi:hypothetical protein